MATRPLIPYGRKSGGEDPEQSYARQRGAIERWAAQHNERIGEMIFQSHVSGSAPWQERELGQVIEQVRQGTASGVVVESQDRLSRQNGLATAEVWDALQKAGARLVCVADGLDTATGDQELNFSIRAALAREQWKQYARRNEAAKKHAVTVRGVHIGPAPFGYRRAPHRPLEVAEPAASAVRQAFALRAGGASVGEVVRLLDRLHPGGPAGRGAWTGATVTKLLANRAYLGEARGGGYTRAGAHPALTDEVTFAACRALARKHEQAETRSRSLLGGLVYCGTCGHPMNMGTVAARYRGYRCRGRHADGICPAPASAMAPALEQLVDDAVAQRYARIRVAAEVTEPEGDDTDLHERLQAARAKRAPFEDPEFVAQLGLDAAKRALATLDDEIDALEDELAEHIAERRRASGAGALSIPATNAAELYAWLRAEDTSLLEAVPGAVPGRRGVIASLVERIVVQRPARRGQPLAERVQIAWRQPVVR